MSPRVVSAAEWLAARKELQAAEEEAMRALEEIAARRRELPAVAVEKDYVFEGPDGQASLPDLFEGRTQLIVQHFMFDPCWDAGCPVCSYQADSGDSFFGLPLWLTTECRGHTLWAYNTAHLDLLEAFVSAQLRERGPILGSMSLVERLPALIKDAKNRDDVIRAIHRLRAKAA